MNVGSGNGLCQTGDRPLAKPMMTYASLGLDVSTVAWNVANTQTSYWGTAVT